MARGGARTGAGRPRGSVNKASREAAEKARESGLLPHELLLAISQGKKLKGIGFPNRRDRIDAAKAAAPYYAPRLAAVVAKISAPGNAWIDIFALIDGQDRGLPSPPPDKPVLKLVDGTGPRSAPAGRSGKAPR